MIGRNESNGYLFNNLETMLEQSQPLFRLVKQIPWGECLNYEGCEIIHADKLRKKSLNKYEKIKIKKMLRGRCGIERIISSLKNHHRLSKNYLSESFGDRLNVLFVLLAAIGYNFKKCIRLFYFFIQIFLLFCFKTEAIT